MTDFTDDIDLEELFYDATPGIVHADKMMEGFESLLKRLPGDWDSLQGSEHYFIGGMRPYAYIGSEAGFWDNIKASSKVVYEAIRKAVSEIKTYFTGDGQKQIDEIDAKSKAAIEGMGKLNGSIPVPEGNSLIKKEKYFKAPSLDGLTESQLSTVNGAISSINSAVSKLDGVNNVGGLINALQGIRDESIKAAKDITNLINKESSETLQAADKLQNPDVPKDDEQNEVKEAKKKEVQENTAEAKAKAKAISKLGSIRNNFLSPAKVVSSSLSQVEKLKEEKEFKG